MARTVLFTVSEKNRFGLNAIFRLWLGKQRIFQVGQDGNLTLTSHYSVESYILLSE